MAKADSADPPLTDHTLYLLSQLGRAGKNRLQRRLADHGLTMGRMAALAVLEQTGPISHAELGRRLGLDPSDVTALVGELRRARWIASRADARDGRRRLIDLNAAGAGALDTARRVTRGVDDELLAPLPADARRDLHEALAVVLDHVRHT